MGHVLDELREFYVPVMQADIRAGQSVDTLMGGLEDLDHSEYVRLFGRPKPAKVVKPPTKERIQSVQSIGGASVRCERH